MSVFLGGYKDKNGEKREVRVIALHGKDRKMAGSGEHNSNLLPTPACINIPQNPFECQDNKRHGRQCREGWYV